MLGVTHWIKNNDNNILILQGGLWWLSLKKEGYYFQTTQSERFDVLEHI